MGSLHITIPAQDGENVNNEEAIRKFLAYLSARPDISQNRYKKYKGQLKRLSEWCPCPFENATREDIEILVSRILKSQLSDWTKYNYFSTIKIFFRWLRKTEEYPPEVRWITRKGLRLGSAVSSKAELLTDEEFHDLLLCAPDAKYRALWALLREKGPRIGEALSCKIGDLEIIDHDTATLRIGAHIRGKNRYSARTIALVDSLPFLTRWLNVHPQGKDPNAWLFPNNQNRRLSDSGALSVLKLAAKKAGIQKRVWHHLFRHQSITEAKTPSIPI